MSIDLPIGSTEELEQLKQAIHTNDVVRVQTLMTRNFGRFTEHAKAVAAARVSRAS